MLYELFTFKLVQNINEKCSKFNCKKFENLQKRTCDERHREFPHFSKGISFRLSFSPTSSFCINWRKLNWYLNYSILNHFNSFGSVPISLSSLCNEKIRGSFTTIMLNCSRQNHLIEMKRVHLHEKVPFLAVLILKCIRPSRSFIDGKCHYIKASHLKLIRSSMQFIPCANHNNRWTIGPSRRIFFLLLVRLMNAGKKWNENEK